MFGQDYMGAYQQPIYGQPQEQMMRPAFRQIQPQVQAMQYPAQRAPRNSMVWVQGEAGAKSYLIAAGNTVPLWDSENQTIYLKSVDASGVPSMRVLDYKERAQTPHVPIPAAKNTGDEFVTRKEFEALAAKLDAMSVKPEKGGDLDG